MSYKYSCIDFELINHRNASVIKSEELTLELLLKINLGSIFKLIRENDFYIPILLFDSKPYYKSEVIGEYKSNRKRYTEEDLKLLDSNSENYQKEYDKINNDIKKNNIINQAKDYIINNWNHFCIPIIYKGLEADDISFYLSKILDDKTLHISKDSDWEYHCTNINHDVLIIKKSGNILYKYDSILDYNIPLEYQKVFDELFKSSHNGINVKKLNLSNEEIYNLYKAGELDDEIKIRINGLNPLTYFNEEVKSFLVNKIDNHYLNLNIEYIKSYNFVKHKEIYGLQQRQFKDSFEDLEDLL